jgi:hypothetical protein
MPPYKPEFKSHPINFFYNFFFEENVREMNKNYVISGVKKSKISLSEHKNSFYTQK